MANKLIKHTLDRTTPINLTGGNYNVRFPRGGVRTVDAERADELVTNHPLIEYADTVPAEWSIPSDYNTLQQLAAAADTDVVDGNSKKADIVAYLERLDAPELDELKANV